MMTTSTEASAGTEARPFTHSLFGLLHMLARGRGHLVLDARSLGGFGQEQLYIGAGLEHLPTALLKLIEEEMEIRVPIVTSSADGKPADLSSLACLWRPQTRFDDVTGWRHAVDAAAAEAIRETLAGFPLPPAFIVDAKREVWACWPLADPLPVDGDPAPGVALLEAMARRLGGDLNAAQNLATPYPAAGPIRNWTTNPPERIEILEVAPGQTYNLEQIQAALAPAPDAGGKEKI